MPFFISLMMYAGSFLDRAANRFRGGVIGARIFLKSLGYNFVSFNGMSLKLIQEEYFGLGVSMVTSHVTF